MLVGFVALSTRRATHVPEAVDQAHTPGITVHVVTGDHGVHGRGGRGGRGIGGADVLPWSPGPSWRP